MNGTDPTGMERFEHDSQKDAIKDAASKTIQTAGLPDNAATHTELASEVTRSFQGMDDRAGSFERQGFKSSTFAGGVRERGTLDKVGDALTFSGEKGEFEVVKSEVQSSNGFISAPGDNAWGRSSASVMNTVRVQVDRGSNPVNFNNVAEGSISTNMQNLANRTGNVTVGTIINSGPTRNPGVKHYVFTPDE